MTLLHVWSWASTITIRTQSCYHILSTQCLTIVLPSSAFKAKQYWSVACHDSFWPLENVVWMKSHTVCVISCNWFLSPNIMTLKFIRDFSYMNSLFPIWHLWALCIYLLKTHLKSEIQKICVKINDYLLTKYLKVSGRVGHFYILSRNTWESHLLPISGTFLSGQMCIVEFHSYFN